jgi:hypothetical protein
MASSRVQSCCTVVAEKDVVLKVACGHVFWLIGVWKKYTRLKGVLIALCEPKAARKFQDTAEAAVPHNCGGGRQDAAAVSLYLSKAKIGLAGNPGCATRLSW